MTTNQNNNVFISSSAVEIMIVTSDNVTNKSLAIVPYVVQQIDVYLKNLCAGEYASFMWFLRLHGQKVVQDGMPYKISK